MDSIDLVLSRLEGVRRSGSGWTARCPAHEDRHNSLAIHVGEDGRVLLHCFAGCTCEEIVAAQGLEMRNLFNGHKDLEPAGPKRLGLTVADLAHDKRLPEAFLRELGVVEDGHALRITYRLADGTPAPRQRIRSARNAKEGSFWTKGSGEVVPYGLWRLEEDRSKDYLVLVEGESDCWTLWHYGIPALGMPGADMTGKLSLEHLPAIDRLFVVREPDRGGETFVAGVAQRLKEIGWAGTAQMISLPDAKDPNELHQRVEGNSEEFLRSWNLSLELALPLPEPPSKGDERAKIEQLLAQARQEIEKLQAEEADEAARLSTDWKEVEEILTEALRSEDPITALDQAMVPALARLAPPVLDDATSKVSKAYRKNGHRVTLKTLEKVVRNAREKADQARQARRARIEELQEILRRSEDGGRPQGTPSAPNPYEVIDGIIRYWKGTPVGPVSVPLCNFTARITGEELRDDGAEQTLVFTIEGRMADGVVLPRAEVSAANYPAMGWVTSGWGTAPVVYAGQGTRDHLRVALQLLSGRVPRRTVFQHLGWRRIEGTWLYLHAGGAIGPQGAVREILVKPGDGRLCDYRLPDPPEGDDLRTVIRASLSLLELAPPMITYPLLAGVYRAPLSEAAFVDFSLFLSGPTGCQKTELTALAQAHYGPDFHGKSLPGNWSATANALEKQAFLAKDALFTVDDFAPSGTVSDVQRLHREADRLLRAQGNRAGRGRMRPDGSSRPEYFPRGLIISSGEDIPRGESLRSRVFTLEASSGQVDLARLTRAQDEAARGIFARAMAGYLKWLAPRLDSLKETLPPRHRELRTEARSIGVVHDRTPDIMASLAVGWETFLRFALEVEAITLVEAAELWKGGWQTLGEVAKTQADHLSSEEPTRRFLSLLSAALSSGQAHLADARTGKEPEDPGRWGWRSKGILDDWQPLGDRIGWVDGDHLLLEPEAAFAAVQKLARDQGTHLAINPRTLWRRMAEKGLLASREPSQGRNLVRWIIAGVRRSVLHFSISVLSRKTVPNVPNVPQPYNHAGLGTEKLERKFDDHEKTFHKNVPQTWEGQDPGPDAPEGLWNENLERKFGDYEKTFHKNGSETQAGQDPGTFGTFGTFSGDKTSQDKSDLLELIAALRREGVTLSIEDGDLRVAGDLKPGMAAVIEQHRSALIALLQGGTHLRTED